MSTSSPGRRDQPCSIVTTGRRDPSYPQHSWTAASCALGPHRMAAPAQAQGDATTTVSLAVKTVPGSLCCKHGVGLLRGLKEMNPIVFRISIPPPVLMRKPGSFVIQVNYNVSNGLCVRHG